MAIEGDTPIRDRKIVALGGLDAVLCLTENLLKDGILTSSDVQMFAEKLLRLRAPNEAGDESEMVRDEQARSASPYWLQSRRHG